MKILFWLYKSRVNSKGLCPIMMRITLHGERTNFPTQICVPEKTWDHDRQQIKGNDELSRKYNQYLLNLKTKAWEIYNEGLRTEVKVTGSSLRAHLQGTDQDSYSLLEALDYYINQVRARIGKDMAPATLQRYETCKRKVVQFLSKEKHQEDYPLHLVNHQFIYELDAFLRSQEGLRNNGVVKHMQQLKRVLKVARLNEWINKDPFANFQCKIEEPKRVHLTKDELERLESIPMPSDRLGRVRNLFVFSCYTGLAYADATKLTRVHLQTIEGREWIILDRTKTKNESVIPLLPKAREILFKYESKAAGPLLPIISSQNINKYLKELAVLSRINKRLTFHAARHTFATTVTLNQGVDIVTVSAMLGHRMLKTVCRQKKVD